MSQSSSNAEKIKVPLLCGNNTGQQVGEVEVDGNELKLTFNDKADLDAVIGEELELAVGYREIRDDEGHLEGKELVEIHLVRGNEAEGKGV